MAAAESLHLLRGALPGVGSWPRRCLEFLERTRAELDARVARDAAARRGRQLADMVIAILRGACATNCSGARGVRGDRRSGLFASGWPATAPPSTRCARRCCAACTTSCSPTRRVIPTGRGSAPGWGCSWPRSCSSTTRARSSGARAGMGDVVSRRCTRRWRRAACGSRWGTGSSGSISRRGGWPRCRSSSIRERGAGARARAAVLPRAGGRAPAPLRVEDFDVVVLAMGLGAVPAVSGELPVASPRWREMVERVATVPTQALQIWLRAGEADVGWPHRGATVSGYVSPFDTHASMSHGLALEDWEDDAPRALGYFCSVLPAAAGADAAAANADAFLDGPVRRWWPGFSPELVAARCVRANCDPSERYVQSLPGTGVSRLPPRLGLREPVPGRRLGGVRAGRGLRGGGGARRAGGGQRRARAAADGRRPRQLDRAVSDEGREVFERVLRGYPAGPPLVGGTAEGQRVRLARLRTAAPRDDRPLRPAAADALEAYTDLAAGALAPAARRRPTLRSPSPRARARSWSRRYGCTTSRTRPSSPSSADRPGRAGRSGPRLPPPSGRLGLPVAAGAAARPR